MSATPQDVLMEAARILVRDGWKQGAIGSLSGPNCASGAIARAAGCHPQQSVWAEDCEFYWRARCILERVTGAATTVWNDAPERTAEDVILALKRAACES